jgi:hypothetical protein
MKKIFFPIMATALSFSFIQNADAIKNPFVKRTTDRDFSCAERCTDPQEVCPGASNMDEMRQSCEELCSAAGKKPMRSKKKITYDINNYRFGDKGIIWGSFFEDVCAGRSFKSATHQKYLADHNMIAETKQFQPALAFDPQQITFFAQAAVNSYDSKRAAATATYRADGWTVYEFPGKSALGIHTAGIMLGKDNLVILAFHGTESRGDLMTDAHALQTSAQNLGLPGQIHKGFYDAFTSSWTDIKALISKYAQMKGLQLKDMEFIVTGHSLGGALASIAAARIYTDTDLVGAGTNNSATAQVKAFTFGSPRVFSGSAARAVDSQLGTSNIVRLWIESDPVPTVPQGTLGYKHVGTSIKIASTPETTAYFQQFTSLKFLTFDAHKSRFYVQLAPDTYAKYQINPTQHAGIKTRIRDLFGR